MFAGTPLLSLKHQYHSSNTRRFSVSHLTDQYHRHPLIKRIRRKLSAFLNILKYVSGTRWLSQPSKLTTPSWWRIVWGIFKLHIPVLKACNDHPRGIWKAFKPKPYVSAWACDKEHRTQEPRQKLPPYRLLFYAHKKKIVSMWGMSLDTKATILIFLWWRHGLLLVFRVQWEPRNPIFHKVLNLHNSPKRLHGLYRSDCYADSWIWQKIWPPAVCPQARLLSTGLYIISPTVSTSSAMPHAAKSHDLLLCDFMVGLEATSRPWTRWLWLFSLPPAPLVFLAP